MPSFHSRYLVEAGFKPRNSRLHRVLIASTPPRGSGLLGEAVPVKGLLPDFSAL